MPRQIRPLPAKMRASRGLRRSARPSPRSSAWGVHTRFVVRKKTFACVLNDHHGDGIVSLCVEVVPGGNREVIASDPGRFYHPAYLSANGWAGLRLDMGEIDWDEVAALASNSYRLVAPKRLAAQRDPAI
jgi:hypothetical protein